MIRAVLDRMLRPWLNRQAARYDGKPPRYRKRTEKKIAAPAMDDEPSEDNPPRISKWPDRSS